MSLIDCTTPLTTCPLEMFERDRLQEYTKFPNRNRAYLVLDPRVLSLGILSDEDRVNIVKGSFVANDRLAGTDIGKEIENSGFL